MATAASAVASTTTAIVAASTVATSPVVVFTLPFMVWIPACIAIIQKRKCKNCGHNHGVGGEPYEVSLLLFNKRSC